MWPIDQFCIRRIQYQNDHVGMLVKLIECFVNGIGFFSTE